MSRQTKMLEIKIGDIFGLWKVVGEPTRSTRGNVTSQSRYSCVCTACNKRFDVQFRSLISGSSKGCRSCAAKRKNSSVSVATRTPKKEKPLCPKCLIETTPFAGNTKTARGTLNRYKCKKCGETVKKFFPYSGESSQ